MDEAGSSSVVGGSMLVDPVALGLVLAGWVVAFLLGKELQRGYAAWREEAASRQRRS
jgi:hypothetical protein